MKRISLLLACLACLGSVSAQTTETVTINGVSDGGFVTAMTFDGGNVTLSYQNGEQKTENMAAVQIDFDYVALLGDESDATNKLMLNTFGGKTVKVQLSRQLSTPFSNGLWSTICLPFDMSAAQIASVFGADTQLAKFSSGENDVVDFTSTDEIKAGLPYLINPGRYLRTIELDDIALKNLAEGGKMSGTDYSFVGTVSTAYPTGTNFYFANGNYVRPLFEGGSIKQFRAYLSSNGASAKAFTIDGVATGIEKMVDGACPDTPQSPAYNLSGQRVGNAYKGIVIKNGKKTITK